MKNVIVSGNNLCNSKQLQSVVCEWEMMFNSLTKILVVSQNHLCPPKIIPRIKIIDFFSNPLKFHLWRTPTLLGCNMVSL